MPSRGAGLGSQTLKSPLPPSCSWDPQVGGWGGGCLCMFWGGGEDTMIMITHLRECTHLHWRGMHCTFFPTYALHTIISYLCVAHLYFDLHVFLFIRGFALHTLIFIYTSIFIYTRVCIAHVYFLHLYVQVS